MTATFGLVQRADRLAANLECAEPDLEAAAAQSRDLHTRATALREGRHLEPHAAAVALTAIEWWLTYVKGNDTTEAQGRFWAARNAFSVLAEVAAVLDNVNVSDTLE